MRKGSAKSNDAESAARLSPPTNNGPAPEAVTKEPDKFEKAIKFLETWTWIFLILLFLLFNLIYWPWLLVSSNYYEHYNETVYYQGT